MTLPEILLLVAAGFGAGVINTIAGGGTFLTFPALVFSGVPPVIANATSTVSVFPGYLSGAAGFLPELRAFRRAELLRLTALSLLGAFGGAALLLVSSDKVFSLVVPFLLLAATLAFLYGETIRKWAARSAVGVKPQGAFGLLAVCVYGGYFNGGLGIVLLALFALWGMEDIHRMNGLKNGLSFAVSIIAVGTFAVAGLVVWPQAVLMMVASTIGGYAGAPISRALPRRVLRGFIALIGFGMSAVFFYRLF
ncbi:sulfite exporter TauE/SafE family protein [Pontibaca methylaminivorans]|uniref:Probable membrane transporter protein n=1 Tax=Pontibaca methylaminivorans TaxID=515897 RepID=A0A1R3WCL4_9RHOB|nr:sulfite exporter TauE/SafE family protein [Pontibaca methylaminivorans]SIT74086.1 hypothetical protein SAMN05421849_0097 [Pontibaca methylaminivorans]